MPIRVVRFQSRNPIVVAAVVALLLAVLAVVLTVGLAVGAALAVVGGAALLSRRVLGRRLPPPERQVLDRSMEVFPREPDDMPSRLPPRAD